MGIFVVAGAQFLTPIGLLEHLVNQQHPSAIAVELTGKVCYTSTLKVEIVHVDIQTLAVRYAITLTGILQQKRSFSPRRAYL